MFTQSSRHEVILQRRTFRTSQKNVFGDQIVDFESKKKTETLSRWFEKVLFRNV